MCKNTMNFKKKRKAFTLIETLVSVTVFMVALVILSQVYINIVRSERVAYALLNSENNIRNNLEIIARSVRMGKNFQLLNGNKELCFDYYLEGEWQKTCFRFNPDIKNLERSYKDSAYYPLFDPQLKLEAASFYLKDSGVNSQKTLVLSLYLTTEVRNQEYDFNLETAITPRFFLGEI